MDRKICNVEKICYFVIRFYSYWMIKKFPFDAELSAFKAKNFDKFKIPMKYYK